jgi:hypothetical protein
MAYSILLDYYGQSKSNDYSTETTKSDQTVLANIASFAIKSSKRNQN